VFGGAVRRLGHGRIGRVTADGDVVPAGYAELLEQLKVRVRSAQVRAARAANGEVLALYWSVGRDILDRQDQAGWGTGVVARLAADLRVEFPDQRGWSRRNLRYMRAFDAAWPDLAGVVPQAVAQVPWGHVRALLDRLQGRAERDWYAARAVADGWSRAVLEFSIGSGLHGRVGAAPSNFTARLPAADSDLA
jgi:predicted nuclease of restriction endonuclease-like (RecB) superfamily